ncbi:tRNA dihydrouridine(20/20a) synthase DusA [Kumtagia ephedrae]|uniref:tRNA-dihydrouridine(20/20a) synthase n=1 Tax=Kumtagia ephedrae TaxID=2116701 RepID=A0A2P7SP52_9HYPH|nr:tRNA dihydrouridine(20/20a) synthase DusA [Mesorhizobium ephedrae]PSJ64269.1 tRNA dihydrouridine(20/20a) synthase DusA [Mesorhizobium ephedrae]
MTERKSSNYNGFRVAVAPMMDWTDRHCRFFHRQLTRRALLYTEMIVADAAIHGERQRLLGFHPAEHPTALQLGGSDPHKLAEAARIGEAFGYDEINLNCGCPSDRVQSGTFGACLMKTPALVAACVAAMKRAVNVPVTVKCRIGVDEQDPEPALDTLADAVFAAGADALWVHARKAWLQGLSPKENRDIPPLDYGRVYRLKRRLPQKFIGINGGIQTVAEAKAHLGHVDGVMLGRAAYHVPAILADVDALVDADPAPVDFAALLETMAAYADAHIAAGGRLAHVTRHMVGLFHGRPGARRFRQILSTEATRPGADSAVLRRAFAAVEDERAAEAA